MKTKAYSEKYEKLKSLIEDIDSKVDMYREYLEKGKVNSVIVDLLYLSKRLNNELSSITDIKISTKKFAQEEPYTGYPEEGKPQELSPNKPEQLKDIKGYPEEDYGEDLFETDIPGYMEERPIEKDEFERDLLKELTSMDLQMYTSLIRDRNMAERSGDIEKVEYYNELIINLLKKYVKKDIIPKEMTPEAFVARKLKAHTMLKRGYDELIQKTSSKLLTALRRVGVLIESGSVSEVDLDNKRVTYNLFIRKAGIPFSKNIEVDVYENSDTMFMYDSFGRKLNFDTAGIVKLFDYIDKKKMKEWYEEYKG